MKKIVWLWIVLPILALVIAVCSGLPVLDWVSWLFNLMADIFSTIGKFCAWLQKLVNMGVIKK